VIDAELRARVAGARVARLATADARGRPHVVPISFALSGERLYSAVDAKPKETRRLKRLVNIAANPSVSVLVDHYEEDWTRLWWVRLDGQAAVVEEPLERERGLALLVEKYDQYRAEAPPGPLLAIQVESWRAWSATG
jgi:PPOX class probable F420-dependent enzyme